MSPALQPVEDEKPRGLRGVVHSPVPTLQPLLFRLGEPLGKGGALTELFRTTAQPSNLAAQRSSLGRSADEIIEGALAAAEPRAGLSWLDIGCGTGELLRAVRDRFTPASLTAVDLINWLPDELKNDVSLVTAPVEEVLDRLEPADRVMLVESLDDLEAPWTALRRAAGLLTPGGLLIITVPSIPRTFVTAWS